ncbi:DNA replication complex GINS protein PSF3 [Ceratocystis lukuohia]|uniref:DNA replication complex GINS protein PSF3 n=3 Tax=Ceratocystis TaxID=5157 RepID=A0A2C5XF98_9PEZI|nr:DNA replication complex GINS protein PSF3 [Ceratocystis fimbriata CBS 114723]
MSYYDVDAILTEAEKVPCTFNFDSNELGYLDNNPAEPLVAGTQLSLPLWLAQMLASSTMASGESAVTMTLPEALSHEVVQALKADPRAVAVRERTANFYNLTDRMLDLFDDVPLAAVVRYSWIVRAAEISVLARRTGEDGNAAVGNSGPLGEEFLRGLDEWERKLFRVAHDARKDVKEWMERGAKV